MHSIIFSTKSRCFKSRPSGGREENGLSENTLLDDRFPPHDAFSAPLVRSERFQQSGIARTSCNNQFGGKLPAKTLSGYVGISQGAATHNSQD